MVHHVRSLPETAELYTELISKFLQKRSFIASRRNGFVVLSDLEARLTMIVQFYNCNVSKLHRRLPSPAGIEIVPATARNVAIFVPPRCESYLK